MSSIAHEFTHGQARAVIALAEEHGFERAPGRYVRWYDKVVSAAEEHGFVAPESDLPLLPFVQEHDRGVAAIELLWTHDTAALQELLGEDILLAPIPESAAVAMPLLPAGRDRLLLKRDSIA